MFEDQKKALIEICSGKEHIDPDLKKLVPVPIMTKKALLRTRLNQDPAYYFSSLYPVDERRYDKKDSAPVRLEDYRLSDRQKDCIKEIVVNNTTIKALAINHNVSESAIKKDLSHIYTSLGITGKADLKALFIGYEF